MEQTDNSDKLENEVFRDGSAENCPDCGGDMQYQNPVAVLCLECGTEFEHFHTTTEHRLFTVTDDESELEIVATAPLESEVSA